MAKCQERLSMKVITALTYSLVVLLTVGVVLIASLMPDLSDIFTPADRLSPFSRYGAERFASSVSGASSLSSSKNTVQDTPDTSSEAVASMNLAREMSELGKMEKAKKLFQHAIALDSDNPDIFNEYGEFLEHYQKDILKAEHMYTRAITHSPVHSRAIANRKRALPLVEEIDQLNFNNIDKKRDLLFQVPDNHAGLRRMKQESYFQHIHHTTALEGNTFTLMETRALVETRMAIGGKSVFEHNEILGLDSALSFINSTLLHRIGAITLEDILNIHKRVLGFVDPFEAGKFRDTQVFVGNFVPPAAAEVSRLVEEFVDWLNHEDTLALHPIEHAALAHYKLVVIHPFYDGNGRTSRLLMNLVLMQAGYPPIIIRKEEKFEYYRHLETANDGDVRPFIRFISKCTERTLDEFLLVSSHNANISFPGISDDGRTIILQEVSSNDTEEDDV